MARINNLTNFLTDVATSIKAKTGDSSLIPASQFDTKIAGITTGKLSNEEYIKANDDLDEILYESVEGLPNEYQQVEYLESSGSQYIDTGVIPNSQTGINLKVSVPNTTSDQIIMGCRKDTGDTRFWIAKVRNCAYFGYNVNYGTSGNPFPITANIPFDAYLNFKNDGICYINDRTPMRLNPITTDFSTTLRIFKRNGSGASTVTPATVYSCKISQGTEIIQDLVPCYRKSDNKPRNV